MEKLAAVLCLHCCPLGMLSHRVPLNGKYKSFPNQAKLWLASGRNVTLLSKQQLRCYLHHRPRYRPTYPNALASVNGTISSTISLWPITNFAIFIIHNNALYKPFCPNGHKLIYNLAIKRRWHHSSSTKCPFPLDTSHSDRPNYLSPTKNSNFEQPSSKRHFCTNCTKLLSDHIQTSTMNKLVNNILRRNSVAVTGVSNAESKFDITHLSKVDYKTAIHLLNQLQTNAENIQQAIEKERSSNVSKSLEKTRYFLSLIGIEPEELNQLRVVHVAGTKGKGSTCAFVESILRHNGFKTGFYSSPHLVVARERIRINGEPISEQKFAQYFSHVYNLIREKKSPDVSMPAYFNFMTVMAFHIFLEEKVDVAILEVGIGGEYDCTNVVPKPIVTGVTSLDLDHTKLLGDKIEQIAWQKAGIFKENVPAFTVKQNEKAMQVLRQRATEKNTSLYVAPSWSIYPQSQSTKLGINGNVQKINASLAVQLAHYWISKCNQPKYIIPTLLTNEGNFSDVISLNVNNYATALDQTKWFGRCEILHKNEITYFLDAAHTPDSMQNCVAWFIQESLAPKSSSENEIQQGRGSIFKFKKPSPSENIEKLKAFRILVFNCTGERNPTPLLSNLSEIGFDLAIFTTNSVRDVKAANSDVANFTVSAQREKEICSNNSQTWSKLNLKVESVKVSCITEAIETIEKYARKAGLPVHVLITGSVHLVGGFIGLIHPHYQADDGTVKL